MVCVCVIFTKKKIFKILFSLSNIYKGSLSALVQTQDFVETCEMTGCEVSEVMLTCRLLYTSDINPNTYFKNVPFLDSVGKVGCFDDV